MIVRIVAGSVVALVAVALLLIVVDTLTPRQCDAEPPLGTRITIPGETMVVSALTDEKLVLDVVRDPFDPRYQLQPEHGHIHPNQAEGFRVIEGRAQLLIGEQLVTLEPGDAAVVPANTLHHWMALDDTPVRVEAWFEPSLEIASWFVHFQKHIADDTMNLLLAAVISREYAASSPAPVSPPPLVWNVVARILAPVGRLMGYRPCT